MTMEKRQKPIKLDASVLARLEALPIVCAGKHVGDPEPWQLKALRLYWATRPQEEVAKIIGVSETTARKWYREHCKEAWHGTRRENRRP